VSIEPTDVELSAGGADRRGSRSDGAPLRSAVIVNPVRVRDLAERRSVIEESLSAAGWPAPAWFETTREDPGTGQARRALAGGAQVVFVCGGDGTVRSVIAGMIGSEAALGLLPAGTGNLLATNLGLPDDPAEGVRLAVERGRRQLDVGRVDGDVFAVLAGMGFDAAIMSGTSAELKARIGSPAYVLTALRHLLDRSMTVEVVIDGQPALRRRARTVLVGNVGRLQGGIRLLPDAEPDSGVLEVAILAPRHLGHWAAMALAILLRRPKVPNMQILRGSRITITSTRPQPRELDGDVIEPGRVLDVVVEPAAIWLCVAQPEESADLTEGA
jgi:diacylglycerol kinase (ATP)